GPSAHDQREDEQKTGLVEVDIQGGKKRRAYEQTRNRQPGHAAGFPPLFDRAAKHHEQENDVEDNAADAGVQIDVQLGIVEDGRRQELEIDRLHVAESEQNMGERIGIYDVSFHGAVDALRTL